MKRILLLHSSLFGDDSAGAQVAGTLVEQLAREHPGSQLTRVDLAKEAPPHLGADEFNSWAVAPEDRDENQQALAEVSDRLIAQLQSHDILVLAVPMYNLGIPSTLKAWIDRVARAGRTFRYTSEGPRGLLQGKRAYLVLTRGGLYQGTPLDTQTPYLESVLGLMGIRSIDIVFAEGLNKGGGSRERSLAGAMAAISELSVNGKREQIHAVA